MRAPEQPKDSYPETLTKSFEKQSFGSFLVLRSVWSISGLLPPPSPEWARERKHCSREQYNLAQTIEKPIENQMRPEDSHYNTEKPYARNKKTPRPKKVGTGVVPHGFGAFIFL